MCEFVVNNIYIGHCTITSIYICVISAQSVGIISSSLKSVAGTLIGGKSDSTDNRNQIPFNYICEMYGI